MAFNGASEGTLTVGNYNPDTKSVHWGLEDGMLECSIPVSLAAFAQMLWNPDQPLHDLLHTAASPYYRDVSLP